MSRTYKYPRESLDGFIIRKEPEAEFRIQQKLGERKHRKNTNKIARLRKTMFFKVR